MSDMSSDQSSPQRSGYSATLPRATEATVQRAIEQIYSSYPAADFHDVDGFTATAAVVLAGFSDVTVRFISDPRTGVQRRLQFAPRIAELVTACEENERYLDRTAPDVPRLARPVQRSDPSLRA